MQLPHRHTVFLLVFLCCWMGGESLKLAAAESASSAKAAVSTAATNATVEVDSNAAPRFNVTAYTVRGNPPLSTNDLVPLLARYTGTNITLAEIVEAAADVQSEYRRQGQRAMSIAIAREQITNGIVTLNVFQAVIPQIVMSGKRYLGLANGPETRTSVPAVPAISSFVRTSTAPASPEEMARARAALFQGMAEAEAREKDTRVHVVSTNTGPRFDVEKYLIMGNTVLPPLAVAETLTNIDGAYGTNVSFDGIRTVVTELQKAYHERGYVTVAVGLPQQKLTNATVKLQVTEGRLAGINVTGNRYFSSNNLMRALPSLHTNSVLNGLIFQAELNRANANQDRQIYPVIGPGPDPGTSDLTLKVRDQLPFHAKLEFDNQNSPGTPDLRVNGSAVYNNLWQREQTLGVQYGFSPEQYKPGTQWPFYDQPAVANYGAFYRLPLGNPEPIEEIIASNPGNFGYDEATRKFNLPPPTGQPDLTLFASRATIDTGLTTTYSKMVTPPGSNPSINRQDVEDSPTVNQDIGGRLSLPLPLPDITQSGISGGLDFKTYEVSSYKTNNFVITQTNYNSAGLPILPPIVNRVASPVPATVNNIEYLPLMLRYDASWRVPSGSSSLGLGLSVNPWYSSETSISSAATNIELHGVKSLRSLTGSTESTGYWVILNPSFSRSFLFRTNWVTSFRVDAQWASEPLISNEQYGIGGVNSVRGYHEGEVFGDTGWHWSLEQQTPPHVVGIAYGNTPLTIRGSVYMDCATVYLLDPQGRAGSTELWGTGAGLAASVGSHWEARFLFSVPLISTPDVTRDQPYFNFSLSAQF